MENLMAYLLSHLQFLDNVWFERVYNIVMLSIPFALVPKLALVIAKPKEAHEVSVLKFVCFLLVQIVVALGAIATANAILFVSMVICAVESLFIIVLATVRGGELQRWRTKLSDKEMWSDIFYNSLVTMIYGVILFGMFLFAFGG